MSIADTGRFNTGNTSIAAGCFIISPDLRLGIVLNQRAPLVREGEGHLPALQTKCTCLTQYIYNIRTLSVNIKFICTSFRNRQNSEPLASLIPVLQILEDSGHGA
jgi:hypothetical protein